MINIICTTPYSIRFGFDVVETLHSHVLRITDEFPNPKEVFVEDIVEQFFNIKLDYDEEESRYIVYFNTDQDKTMFLLKYSELLDGVQS